jgi:hypothetical protein
MTAPEPERQVQLDTFRPMLLSTNSWSASETSRPSAGDPPVEFLGDILGRITRPVFRQH